MKSIPLTLPLFLALNSTACVEEGHSPECGAGGRAGYEEVGCVTPIGGSCLTHDEFVQDRPASEEPPQDPEEDWLLYMEKRPHCDFEKDGGSGDSK